MVRCILCMGHWLQFPYYIFFLSKNCFISNFAYSVDADEMLHFMFAKVRNQELPVYKGVNVDV